MEKLGYAFIWAFVGSSCFVVGCTPHDTNSPAVESGAGSPGEGGSSGSSNDNDAGDAGTGGKQLIVGGASGTDPSTITEPNENSTTGGRSSSGGNGTGGSPPDDDAGAPGASSEAGSAGDAGSSGAVGNAGSASSGGAGGSANTAPGPLNGYTFFSYQDAIGNLSESELIDMNGNVVRRWSVGGTPIKMLPGGDVIGTVGIFPGDTDALKMTQVSWAGDERWSFQNFAPVGDGTFASRQHHDFQREGNPVGYWAPGQDFVDHGSTLVLAHSRRNAPDIRPDPLDDDVIYEVDGDGNLKGATWQAADHVAEFGFDEAALADIRTRNPGTTLDWLHLNSMSLVGPNHWYDEGHPEFAPENLIISSRNAAFVAIIERATGKIVWRIGPDFAGRPEEKLGQFSGQHNPHLIPKGLPGAGNMIVFDNGWSSGWGGDNGTYRYSRGWSRVVEFNPVTLDVVWQYGSETGSDQIFSFILSNEQRLPNGNTVITLGALAKIIEVTPSKEVVWQYDYTQAPVYPGQIWLYRSYRIAPEWLPADFNAAHGNYSRWGDLFPTR